jgi:hypothetical protein
MADHLRKRIRAAVTTALTGLATTGSRVYASRVYPLNANELPALRIYADEESATITSLAGASSILERRLAVRVEACVEAVTGFDDTADQIAKEVEIALTADYALGGLVKWIFLSRIDQQLSGEGDRPVAVQTLTFEAMYYATANAPDQPR